MLSDASAVTSAEPAASVANPPEDYAPDEAALDEDTPEQVSPDVDPESFGEIAEGNFLVVLVWALLLTLAAFAALVSLT